MLKKGMLYLLFLLFGTTLSAQENVNKLNSKVVNCGFKVGFNALSSTYYDVFQNDTAITNKSFTNKVGFVGGLFMRINLNSFFMQPEVTFNYSRESFDFQPIPPQGEVSGMQEFNVDYYSLAVPVLAGYNIVKEGPFLFNLFVGPSFRYKYKTHFNENGYSFNDESAQYNINIITGFSLGISHLHFDFRYEICRPNTNIEFNKIANAPEFLQNIRIKKNENILSFSCGLMF